MGFNFYDFAVFSTNICKKVPTKKGPAKLYSTGKIKHPKITCRLLLVAFI